VFFERQTHVDAKECVKIFLNGRKAVGTALSIQIK
jgi:hypothetical protein